MQSRKTFEFKVVGKQRNRNRYGDSKSVYKPKTQSARISRPPRPTFNELFPVLGSTSSTNSVSAHSSTLSENPPKRETRSKPVLPKYRDALLETESETQKAIPENESEYISIPQFRNPTSYGNNYYTASKRRELSYDTWLELYWNHLNNLFSIFRKKVSIDENSYEDVFDAFCEFIYSVSSKQNCEYL